MEHDEARVPVHSPPLLACSVSARFKQLCKSCREYLSVRILNTYWVYSPHNRLEIALRRRRFAGVWQESDKVGFVIQNRIPAAVWGDPSVPHFMSQWVWQEPGGLVSVNHIFLLQSPENTPARPVLSLAWEG